MNSTPEPELARLIGAHDLALAALIEITPRATVGEPAGHTEEGEGVISLRFHTTLPGYPGWFWTVSVAAVEGEEPTILEVELLPGDGALLAPEWVPWAVRLADYHAAQALAASERDDEGDDDDELDDDLDDDDDDDDDDDESDFDEDGSPILHSGDVDGVDIDELDEDAPDDDGTDEDDELDDDGLDMDDESDEEESDDEAGSDR